MIAYASAASQAVAFVDTLNRVIIFPTIALLSGVALLLFVWGCFEYFMNANSSEGRTKGVKHITWGIIGLVIMLSAYSLLAIFTSTFGLDAELQCATDGTGCEDTFQLPD
jgi:ABC-type proline/glycine betaine transport system permease subunit